MMLSWSNSTAQELYVNEVFIPSNQEETILL